MEDATVTEGMRAIMTNMLAKQAGTYEYHHGILSGSLSLRPWSPAFAQSAVRSRAMHVQEALQQLGVRWDYVVEHLEGFLKPGPRSLAAAG